MSKSELERLTKKIEDMLKKKYSKIRVPDDPCEFFEKFLGFKPFSYQRDLIYKILENQFTIIRWCRQSGKTWTVSAFLLWYMLKYPNSNIAIIGPSFRQSKRIIKIINNFLEKLPKEWYYKKRKTIIEITNGSTTKCFPNNPETIRGPTFDIIFWDEMNFTPNDKEMFDAILFTLITRKYGKFIGASTPFNIDSVFYAVHYEPAFQDYVKSHITWREALEPNGPIKRNMFEKLRKQYEGDQNRWIREMEAEWVEDETSYLPQSLIAKCIDHDLDYVEFEDKISGREIYIGLDLGKKHDYSVISAVDKKDDLVRHIHLKRFPLGTSYASVIGYVKVLCDRWSSVNSVHVDQTGVGEYIVEDMKNIGLGNIEGVMLSLPRKEEIMSLLKQKMKEGKVKFPYDRDFIAELNVEKYEMTKQGRIRFYHPEGTHDDMLWAFALAVYAAFTGPSPDVIRVPKIFLYVSK